MPAVRAKCAARRICSSECLRSTRSRMRWLAPSEATVRLWAPPACRALTRAWVSRSARSDETPTSRPEPASVCSSSTMRGWSVTAAPTRPTRRAASGMSESTRSGGTVRIPPLVVRRITQ